MGKNKLIVFIGDNTVSRCTMDTDLRELKVAFFRKCDEIFSDKQISKKNIPKNYPELDI